MKIKFGNFLFVFLILTAAAIHPSKVWASGHGCSTNEPDRDGDGVPDKDDAFPDDPTRSGTEDRYCGPIMPEMKVYFVPFQTEPAAPVTPDTIEKGFTNAFWVCSQNDTASSIKNILDQGIKNQTETVPAEEEEKETSTVSKEPEAAAPQEEQTKEEKEFAQMMGESGDESDEAAEGPEGPEGLGKVSPNEIRLKVEIPKAASKTVYLVDKFGEGVKNGVAFKLTESQISALAAKIKSLTESGDPKVVDLNLANAVKNSKSAEAAL